MSNLLVKVNSIDELLYPSDGYILGLEGFSICFDKTFSLDEIISIKNKTTKKLFVSLNRLVFEDELKLYKDVLKKLDDLSLEGIIVGDVAALTYNLKTNIILDQLHLNNNYLTCKHYYENGSKGIFLSNDITLSEINFIKEKNKDSILFKQVFGYPHLSTSKRKLVSNYLEYFNKDNKSKYYKINEKPSSKFYNIIEDYYGTHILGSSPLNLLDIIDDLKVDYLVFDSFLIDNTSEVFEFYKNKDTSKCNYINSKYNCNKGFIDTKTIYKVKNYE